MIKTVDYVSDDDFIDFIREAVIQAYMAHRFPGKVPALHSVCMGIYRVWDSSTGNRKATYRFIFEMEYVQGESLWNLLQKGLLTPAELCQTLQSVRTLLDEFQGATGFVHRDLHSGNVCRKADGTVVLIDYGHSSLWDGEPSEPDLAVIGGHDPEFHIPVGPPPADLTRRARRGWANVVQTYGPKASVDPSSTSSKRYYQQSSDKLANLGKNLHARSGDLFYFILRIAQNVKSRAGFEKTYYALRELYQVGSTNLFDVLDELDKRDLLDFIAYFASKEPELLAAVFPKLTREAIDEVLHRFGPENAHRVLRTVRWKVTGEYHL